MQRTNLNELSSSANISDSNMVNAAPKKKRFVLHHVWKTGGTELCRLARANGWHVPTIDGCSLKASEGWPQEDFDLIGQESMLGLGPRFDFYPKNSDEIEVHDVQWITILRHPFSRSLSHYHHASSVYKNTQNKSADERMKSFFQGHGCRGKITPCHFPLYVPDQQTRWICGISECQTKINLEKKDLLKAISNIQKFHVVLILEDMDDPNSCTRRQMRHVLNFTKVQVLSDLKKVNNSYAVKTSLARRSGTRWEDILPRLTSQANSSSSEGDLLGPEVVAELGLRNAFDLQLYGYARHRCEELAAQIDAEGIASSLLTNRSSIGTNPPSLEDATPVSPSFYPMFPICFGVLTILQMLLMRPSKFRKRKA